MGSLVFVLDGAIVLWCGALGNGPWDVEGIGACTQGKQDSILGSSV